MSDTRDLLIELGCEELPPKALTRLMRAFADEVAQGLQQAGLGGDELQAFATPRRLAVRARAVLVRTPDQDVERRGPALQAAFDAEGRPTKAAEGFARSCGVEVEALQRLETDKGTWLGYCGTEPGQAAQALLPAIVDQALAKLPIPKRMRWGAGEAAFVRPVHWLVLLFGDEVVEAEVLGIRSNRSSRGHRFHHPQELKLESAASYEAQLEQAHVLVDFERRRARVAELVHAAAAELGGRAVVEDELLEEVTALVEWPAPVLGRFEEAFLEVPAEALISSMQGHQRYFPVRDGAGRLMARFVAVANIDSRDPAAVRAGNERVIRPRLADAAFFWQVDRKQPLAARIDWLKDVVFQKELGSFHDKTERVKALARTLATQLGVDEAAAERAAALARCDLATEMVGEFPELQGVMGRYYAAHDGEPEQVAAALDEQYQPRFAGDATAAGAVGQVLAVAERADTLMGIFAIGRGPSGDKDPFALRRAALGLMRTLIERDLPVDLLTLLERAAALQPAAVNAPAQVETVFEFCVERLRGYYLDQGVSSETFDAVAAVRTTRPLDFHRRLQACQAFVRMPEAESLAAANKRIRNILRKSAEGEVVSKLERDKLVEAEELALYDAVRAAEADVAPLLEHQDYEHALARLAQLREPVDLFFDKVMVMAEDPTLRGNRLALLERISALFLAIADVSRLPGA